MATIAEVNFEEVSGRDGNLGLITLTRPQVLNALNHTMFLAMYDQLTQWCDASNIKAVIIRAAPGRAFCAGGDIRSIYDSRGATDATLQNFFRDEYCLDSLIHHFPKPYIALLDGITMGGGAGVSIHGTHRVVTSNFTFAMPETGIGFYPDVGATYFLSRLPDKMGVYLGLTGSRISYAECLAIGLVDFLVKNESFPDLIYQLADAQYSSMDPNASVSDVLQKLTVSIENSALSNSALLAHRAEVAECFAKNTVEGIIAALINSSSHWCQEVAAGLQKKSPTSLKVTLEALQKAEHMEFDACMQMEYQMTTRFIQEHDFFEGIRAVVIDKDQSPRWEPAQLTEISSKMVEKYFMTT